MAQIIATTKEVEVLVQAFPQKDISGLAFVIKDGKVAIQNINVEGDAEFKGINLGYSLKLTKTEGLTANVNLK